MIFRLLYRSHFTSRSFLSFWTSSRSASRCVDLWPRKLSVLPNILKISNPSKTSRLHVQLRTFSDTMAPTVQLATKVDKYVHDNNVMIFSLSTCPFCKKAKALFDHLGVKYLAIEMDLVSDGQVIKEAVKVKTGKTSAPQIFIDSKHIGGFDDLEKIQQTGELNKILKLHSYDYDLVVIGGGSGGMAASKRAASFGRKVLVVDFVQPTPVGTTWGLGGTCVNVGCIPKKLMHQSALLGQHISDSYNHGWQTINGEPFELRKTIKHDWGSMVTSIQNYIKSLNWGYKTELKSQNVTYLNSYASFEDEHKIKLVDKKNNVSFVTTAKVILATGERPSYPDIKGAKEYGITSDDLFSLPYSPGKTLVVGASYVALECAGFLKGLGYDVTIMVRSIFLRGFDQDMAEKVGAHMKGDGIKIYRPCVPNMIEKIQDGKPGKLRVTAKIENGDSVVEDFNTVIFAVGRNACTTTIGLEKTGVIVNKKNGKIPTTHEQTNVPHIYAIGDILEGRLELTPVAIQAGKLLADRIFGKSEVQCDYLNVPTTVFTPLEYGAVGYSEEKAIEKFGADNVEAYISFFNPLEWKLSTRSPDSCYAKLICLKNEKERAVGFHYLGPNAGEVTQLAGIVLKKKSTKSDFDALIGIHPTCAEIFTTLTVTRSSGADAKPKGC